ncbi:hypothetical protein [Paenibacillus mendelii]|uniref:hypothetical protein n=1 Tax=Paenibacillus mendelii TaxID=206163 RepID=UPI00359C98A7
MEESGSLFKPILDLLEKGKQENLLKPLNTRLLLTYSCAPIVQLAKEYHKGNFQFNDENITEIIRMSWDSIKE